MAEAADLAERRRRLAGIERELARLQHCYGIAMSAFLFEEAAALGREIDALDKQRQAVAAELPAPDLESETNVVPMLARPRRPRRR